MRRKLFTLFLALVASIGTMFAEKVQIGDLYYNLNATDQTAEVTSQNGSDPYWSTTITTADIPASVTYNEVVYSVISIGGGAFWGCSSLTSIEIPNSVTSIEDYAFYNCSSLTSIEIPNSVTSIGGNAFEYCTGLTSVTIPNSVTSIGRDAFSGCSGLTSITCEAENPPALGNAVFDQVDKSIPLYVPAGSIEDYRAADQWQDFSNILPIPCILASGTCGAEGDNLTWKLSCDSVLTISGTGEMADYSSHTPWYSNIEAIVSVVIENGVTSIDGAAFSQCNNLKSIIIGNSVSDIGEYNPFAYCRNLSSIVVSSSNTTFDSRNGCNAIIEKSTNSLRVGSNSTIIPNDVINIGKGAFQGCESLTNIEIPNSVTSIYEWAFYRCKGLTSVEIPNNVITIGEYAFSECYLNLTSVTIGDGVTSIGKSAFERCIDMSSVSIGSNVTNIGSCAFISCTSLSTITCKAATPPTCGSDVFYNVSKSIPLYVPAESVEAYRAAEGWKEFTNIQAIKSSGGDTPLLTEKVQIGDLYYNLNATDQTAVVTSQNGESPYWSTTITTADIPASVTYNEVVYSVTSIGDYAFCNCSSLTSVTIPNSVTSFGIDAFGGCDALTSIDIPNSVTNIGDAAFEISYSLTSVTISSNVTRIGNRTFWYCFALTSVTIPSSVTSIGDSVFYNCIGLTSVDISNSVTSIGAETFAFCNGLSSIICRATNVPELTGNYVFWDVDKSIPLYVPYESISSYQAADQWKDFTNILPIPGTEPQETEITVIYKDKDAAELDNEQIALHLPDAPIVQGFTFVGWDVVAGHLDDGIIVQAIYTYDGVATSAPAEVSIPGSQTQKLIREGNVYILRDNNTYSITGTKVQ